MTQTNEYNKKNRFWAYFDTFKLLSWYLVALNTAKIGLLGSLCPGSPMGLKVSQKLYWEPIRTTHTKTLRSWEFWSLRLSRQNMPKIRQNQWISAKIHDFRKISNLSQFVGVFHKMSLITLLCHIVSNSKEEFNLLSELIFRSAVHGVPRPLRPVATP